MTTPRILVVDDHPVNRKLVEVLLTRMGYRVGTASNGEEALSALRAEQSPYALVVMDCQMPIRDGLSSTRCLRDWEEEQGLPRLPVVALTAGGGEISRCACLEAGMDAYLLKPVDSRLLQETIKKLLAKTPVQA